jgi:IPT/TIG domain
VNSVRNYSVFVVFLAFLIGALVVMPATALGQGTGTSTPGTMTPVPNAAITTTTSKASPGTSITVNGTGFQGGETVDVTFNGQPVGEPTSSGDGNWALTFTIPNVAPGDYAIAATGRASGRTASKTFTVQLGAASLTFSTNQAMPGAAITINGTGFQPGETVGITFNGPSIGTVTADTSGNITLPFTIPQLGPGQYGVTATGQTSNREANANFTVLAGPTPVATAVPTAAPEATATPAPAPNAPTAPALAHDERYFSQTGYRVDNDQIWAFFQQFGGVSGFGYPTSRMLTFLGCPVQFFQRQIIQVCPGQGAALINMLDPEIFPYTRVNGSVFPAPDDALKANTPPVSDPQYAEKITAFVQANVPDNWNGQPVMFLQQFNSLGGLQIWGAPISQPAPDPSNGNFIYQRFQRGIMHFVAPSTTESILLADYLKAIIMNQNVPGDLLAQSNESRYFNQYCPGQTMWLCRPNDLPGTDLTFAFVQG